MEQGRSAALDGVAMKEIPSWTAVAREFRYYLKGLGRSDETARTYLSNVAGFWQWCIDRETDPRIAERQAIRRWSVERQEQVSSQRAHNDLAALRQFYAFAREEHWRDDDPLQGLRVKRVKALPTEPLSRQDLDTLLGVCTDERDRMIVLFLAYTGLRIAEIASLQAEDIDWQKGTVRLIGKGNKERRIAPNPEVMRQLRAYLGMFPTGPLWLSKKQQRQLSAHQLRKILYDIAGRAKVRGVHPHRLRSFFATEYIDQFADIQALQGLMGHASIETTARYAEYTKERRGLDQMRRFGAGATQERRTG